MPIAHPSLVSRSGTTTAKYKPRSERRACAFVAAEMSPRQNTRMSSFGGADVVHHCQCHHCHCYCHQIQSLFQMAVVPCHCYSDGGGTKWAPRWPTLWSTSLSSMPPHLRHRPRCRCCSASVREKASAEQLATSLVSVSVTATIVDK